MINIDELVKVDGVSLREIIDILERNQVVFSSSIYQKQGRGFIRDTTLWVPAQDIRDIRGQPSEAKIFREGFEETIEATDLFSFRYINPGYQPSKGKIPLGTGYYSGSGFHYRARFKVLDLNLLKDMATAVNIENGIVTERTVIKLATQPEFNRRFPGYYITRISRQKTPIS